MLHFCTYFDHRYLSRALVLHASLQRHCPSFTLWALCLSRESLVAVQKLAHPDIRPISLEELEAADPEFHACKSTRSAFEYFMTSSPCLPLYLLRKHREIDAIHYVDADICFFGDPQVIIDEIADHSIAITPHRFSSRNRYQEALVGTYNVGWLTFRNDAAGLECLQWWRARCIEWCYHRVEPERFADQKYLNQFERRFRNLKIIENPAVNLAPWNLENYRVEASSPGVLVDGRPLVFFHFSGVRHMVGRWYQCARYHPATRIHSSVRDGIYRPYLLQIQDIDRRLDAADIVPSHMAMLNESEGIARIANFMRDVKSLLLGAARRNLLHV